MVEKTDKALKPIVLKTPLGFDYFDYEEIVMIEAKGNASFVFTLGRDSPVKTLSNLAFIEKKYCNNALFRCHKSFIINLFHVENLCIKKHQVHLKKNLIVPLSVRCLRMIRQMSVNTQTMNNARFIQENPNNQFFNNMKLHRFYRQLVTLKGIGKKFKKTFRRFLLMSLTTVIIVLVSNCEGKDRFYRPNLQERLCSIGLIDIDGTTHYISAFPELLDNRYSTRYITFERSFQKEYPEEVNDSLREFSFKISSSEGELFNYQSDSVIKNFLNFKIPDSLKFVTDEKYWLRAKEKDSPEISAEVTVPKPPSELSLISVDKEMIPLSKLLEGWNIDTLKSAVLRISFNNNNEQKQFYALIMVSKYLQEGIGFPFSGFLDFSVRESNSPGFFAEMYGIKVMRYPYILINGIQGIPSSVSAYFIDGSKIPDIKCNITLTTQFHGPYSVSHGGWSHDTEIFSSIRIKLLSIPEELYLFEKSLYTYGKVKDDPFSEPVYLNGNIKGGNGVFAICRSTEIIINFSPPY